VKDSPGVAARLFQTVASAGVNVDVIVQNISEEGETDISFTVGRDDLSVVRNSLNTPDPVVSCRELLFDAGIAKVSLVGVGMRSHTGVASRMFQALAELGVNIQMISTSAIRVSVVIDEAQADDAVRALHKAFDLAAGQGTP
jgi:aspartate kinase